MIERNMLLSGEIARITRHMTNCVIHTSSRVHAELTKNMINEKLLSKLATFQSVA